MTKQGLQDERQHPLVFGQKDHVQVFNFILDCFYFLEVRSGFSDTRDQTCWLAKECNLLSVSLYSSTTVSKGMELALSCGACQWPSKTVMHGLALV